MKPRSFVVKIRICVVAASLSFLGACASTSQPPAPIVVATAAPTTSTGAPAAGVTADQQLQFIRLASRLGYHVEMVNNERHYCKVEDVTNSHLTHKECVDESQMAAKIKAGPDAQRNGLPMNGGNSAAFGRIAPTAVK
jgi:hypothetical protein